MDGKLLAGSNPGHQSRDVERVAVLQSLDRFCTSMEDALRCPGLTEELRDVLKGALVTAECERLDILGVEVASKPKRVEL